MRWVDVSGAEWRLKREGSGGRLLSLHGATHGGVKHGETVRMIDGILRRCRHAMGVYSPLPFAGQLGAHTIKGNPRSRKGTPPGGARARGRSLATSSESPQMTRGIPAAAAPSLGRPPNTVGKKPTVFPTETPRHANWREEFPHASFSLSALLPIDIVAFLFNQTNGNFVLIFPSRRKFTVDTAIREDSVQIWNVIVRLEPHKRVSNCSFLRWHGRKLVAC